ncbi:tRNA (adenosine(37)-N6)-threonylcarbamoyltransferase complex transferase subunit TsaD [archaeon]|jgi:N6-L-threonylcarbamoyladenine synthase|nr:tRNA (adenosine(37)-N6)-threonylcarbamoyltransferase complex transferase subunit TsaD [archaeon]MBT6734971.1 tRNA (adenosine(37)-N6)-threonylcarbamoyltransferase complex transferase subunit TsaD [Candidatus Woesearchaeota archaeon]
MTIVIGIESTAHTFGVGVVKNGKVLANVREMYTTEEGGIIPMDSAKHHEEVSEEIYLKAIKESGIAENKIDAIAFSQSPGLAPCLIEGMKFAKVLSKRLNKPLVSVNHCVAHLEIGSSLGTNDPVMLYASGANTQVIAYEAGKYRVFGETLDLGVGNFIDTFARFAGLGFPGGPKIEQLALKSKRYIELPYKVKGMDIALAGIQTNLKQKLEKGIPIEDLAYSMQETVFAMLIETAERAMAHTGKTELLLGGGVACNSRLQEMAKIMCEERGAKLFVPERPLLVDNGAMIAYLGEIMFNAGVKTEVEDLDSVDIDPRLRTDQIDVVWK